MLLKPRNLHQGPIKIGLIDTGPIGQDETHWTNRYWTNRYLEVGPNGTGPIDIGEWTNRDWTKRNRTLKYGHIYANRFRH